MTRELLRLGEFLGLADLVGVGVHFRSFTNDILRLGQRGVVLQSINEMLFFARFHGRLLASLCDTRAMPEPLNFPLWLYFFPFCRARVSLSLFT